MIDGKHFSHNNKDLNLFLLMLLLNHIYHYVLLISCCLHANVYIYYVIIELQGQGTQQAV